MRTLRRFVYRIFLPLLAVTLVAVVLRFIMVRDFNQENVRFTDGTESTYPHRGDSSGSTGFQNREIVLSDLRASIETLRTAASETGEDPSRQQEAERRLSQLMQSLEELEAADAANWEQRLQSARNRLQDYARFVDGERE